MQQHYTEFFIFMLSLLSASVFAETVKAVNRAITAGLERDFCFSAAAGTDCRMHFTLGTGSSASIVSLLAIECKTHCSSILYF